MLAPYAHRDFRLFAAATVVGSGAITVQSLGRVWLLQELSHSPLVIGLASAASGLPVLVFGLFGGYLGDRYNRKTVLVTAESLAVVAALILAALAVFGDVQTWQVLALTVAQGSALAVAMPIRQTLITDLVPQAQQRNALGQSALAGNVAGIAGATVGGLLLTFAGTTTTLISGALIGALSVPLLLLVEMKQLRSAAEREANVLGGLREGIRYAISDPVVRWLMLVTPVMLIALSTRGVVYPAIVQDELGRGAGSLGLLEFAGAIGAVFGPLIFVTMSPRMGDYRLLVAAGFIFGATVVMMAYSPSLLLLATFSGVTTCIGQVFFVTNWTAMQLRPPVSIRARVVSVRFVIASTQHLGIIGLGALAQTVGPRPALAWFAIVGTAVFAVTLFLLPPKGWARPPGKVGPAPQ